MVAVARPNGRAAAATSHTEITAGPTRKISSKPSRKNVYEVQTSEAASAPSALARAWTLRINTWVACG